VLYVALNKTL